MVVQKVYLVHDSDPKRKYELGKYYFANETYIGCVGFHYGLSQEKIRNTPSMSTMFAADASL